MDSNPIETRIEFSASPRVVFKEISDPRNVPNFVPGVLRADVVERSPSGVGTRLSLETPHHERWEATIVAEAERRFLALQDEKGTIHEWELREVPTGTLAIHRVFGSFGEIERGRIERETRAKLFAFKEFLESKLESR